MMFDICERAGARLAGMAHIAALVLALRAYRGSRRRSL